MLRMPASANAVMTSAEARSAVIDLAVAATLMGGQLAVGSNDIGFILPPAPTEITLELR